MLQEKKLKEAESRIKQFISEGTIKTKENPEHVDFYLKNADDSINSAKALFELSTNPAKQQYLGFTSFNGLLQVVNASYYSMFYMARALLENGGIKIKTNLSIHAVTFDSVIYYFYLTGKLQKELTIIEKKFNIRHIFIRPGYPQSNGKIERWFGSYKMEFSKMNYEKVTDCITWTHYYNFERLHQSLYYETPAHVYLNVNSI